LYYVFRRYAAYGMAFSLAALRSGTFLPFVILFSLCERKKELQEIKQVPRCRMLKGM
jgi:hypothetical protein